MLTDAQQRNAAKKFAAEWNGRGYEKGETHAFWMELLHMVCGVANPAQFITFESQVQLGHTSFIDAYIPETKVMIEQKSLDVDLNKPAKQSDGSMLTPYQQAKRYADQLPNSQRPRYIVVCNFQDERIKELLNAGILIKKNGKLKIQREWKAKSPSDASRCVLGHQSNGWKDWKDSDNKTLNEYFRS